MWAAFIDIKLFLVVFTLEITMLSKLLNRLPEYYNFKATCALTIAIIYVELSQQMSWLGTRKNSSQDV